MTGPVATATRHRGPGRIDALDGLRALAVLLVMAGHSDVPYLERAGGPVGVTTFFVLSGFLITSMLMNDEAAGRLQLRTFYWKRFVRLAPALVVMVVLTTTVGLVAGQGWPVLRDAATSLLYVSNWGQSLWHESVPQLSVTWSLSVEEQYYLVWPLVLLPLLRRFVGRRLVLGLLGVAALALVVRAVATTALPVDVAYRLTTVNAFPLVVGGLLAALVAARRRPDQPVDRRLRRWSGEVAVVGLCALLGLLSARPSVPEPLQLWVGVPVTVIAAGIIWCCVHGSGIVLRIPPVVWLGRISYSLYLWHLAFMRTPGLPLVWAWPISVAVAALSWRFVEEPARRLLLARGVWFGRFAPAARPRREPSPT